MSQPESVVCEPRQDVQVDVKDLLSGGFAVSEKQVDAFGSETGASDRARESVRDLEHGTSIRYGQIGESRRVRERGDEEVTRGNRVQIHERHASVVAINDTRWRSPGNDLAENAGHLCLSGGSSLTDSVQLPRIP